MNKELADRISKIKHFATGDCSMSAKDRLAVIARLCECIEAEEASKSEADKALHALIDAAKARSIQPSTLIITLLLSSRLHT